MKNSFSRYPPKWYGVGIFLLVWVSLWICIYLIMLQPLGGVISQKYAAVSGGIGLLLTLPVFGLMWLRPDIIGTPKRETLVRIIFKTLFFCLVVWFVLPLTRNIILAPITHISLNFQGQKDSFVDIIWLRSGLGDIPFESLAMDQNSQIESESVRIKLDKDGQAELSWNGRAWKQVSMVMETSHPVKIATTIDSKTITSLLDPKTQPEFELVLPVREGFYYGVINFLLLPFFFIAVGYIIFLFHTLLWGRFSPIRYMNNVVSKIPLKPLVKWACILISIVYALLALLIIATGFLNRLYLDDFCYINILQRYGFFGAIFNNYLEINGRFSSHVLNYLAFSFGKASVPFGAMIAFLGVGASQYYFIRQLFIEKDNNVPKAKWNSRFIAILFALIVLVTTSLIAPALYESIYWTLHSLIVTGSLFLLNIFIGLVLVFTSGRYDGVGQLKQALVFAPVGFFAMGFSEAASLFLFAVYCLVVLILIVKKRFSRNRGLVLGFFIGMVGGFLVVANAPASANRVGLLGFSINPMDIFSNIFNLIQSSFRVIFLENSGIGLAVFFIALLAGYTIGRAAPTPLRFANHFPRTAFGQFILLLLPIMLTIITLLPSALVNNYLPLRTMFIPIYLLVVQYFIISIYFGHRDSIKRESTPLILIFTSISVLVIGIIGLVSVGNLARQIRVFATEFDAREAEIFQARNSGLDQIQLAPYNNQITLDIPPDPSNWYVGCLNEYYGMKLSAGE